MNRFELTRDLSIFSNLYTLFRGGLVCYLQSREMFGGGEEFHVLGAN